MTSQRLVEEAARGVLKMDDNTVIRNNSEVVDAKLLGVIIKETSGEIVQDFIRELGRIRNDRLPETSLVCEIYYTSEVYPILDWESVVKWIDFFIAEGAPVGKYSVEYALRYRIDNRVIVHLVEKHNACVLRQTVLGIATTIQQRGEDIAPTGTIRDYILRKYFSKPLSGEELREWLEYLCTNEMYFPRTTFLRQHIVVFFSMFKYASEQCLAYTLMDNDLPPTYNFVEAVAKKNLDAWHFLVWECGFPNKVTIAGTTLHNGVQKEWTRKYTCL